MMDLQDNQLNNVQIRNSHVDSGKDHINALLNSYTSSLEELIVLHHQSPAQPLSKDDVSGDWITEGREFMEGLYETLLTNNIEDIELNADQLKIIQDFRCTWDNDRASHFWDGVATEIISKYKNDKYSTEDDLNTLQREEFISFLLTKLSSLMGK